MPGLQPAGKGMAGVCGALTKIVRRQFDRLAMRRAVGGMVPGVAVTMPWSAMPNTLGGDEALQRRKPMRVVGLTRIGIAGGLRALDLLAKRLRPFTSR